MKREELQLSNGIGTGSNCWTMVKVRIKNIDLSNECAGARGGKETRGRGRGERVRRSMRRIAYMILNVGQRQIYQMILAAIL